MLACTPFQNPFALEKWVGVQGIQQIQQVEYFLDHIGFEAGGFGCLILPTPRMSQHFPMICSGFRPGSAGSVLDPLTVLSLAAYKIVRLAGAQGRSGFSGHRRPSRFPCAVQKETHLCGGGRILQRRTYSTTDRSEELNRFEGSPYLFPTARQSGRSSTSTKVLSRLVTLSSTPERLWLATPNISLPFSRRRCGTGTRVNS